MPELRKDPVSGRSVIIASERAERPRLFGHGSDAGRAEPCPFCSGREAMTPPEVFAHRDPASSADLPGWTVRVVPNKYPALTSSDTRTTPPDEHLYSSRAAVGVHEVVIESPEHIVSMAALDDEQTAQVLRAYRQRISALSQDPRWRYMLIYKNQGDRAGASLEHVHSQLVALPALPAPAADELERARNHYATTGRCFYCHVIEREIGARARLVLATDRFVVLCPFAPRFAHETWIWPRRHTAAFEQSSDEELTDLARVMREVLARLDRALGDPPLNYLIQSIHPPPESHYHWRMEILPQLARAAGFEWGTGLHLNPVAPERAARFLRNAI